jgi:hypothetical protein
VSPKTKREEITKSRFSSPLSTAKTTGLELRGKSEAIESRILNTVITRLRWRNTKD